MNRADARCCVALKMTQQRCVVLDQKEDAMKPKPEKVSPATTALPTARALDATERMRRATTATVEVTIPLNETKNYTFVLWPQQIPPLLRALGEAMRPACGGRSIIGMIEEDLDNVVERLMTGGEAEDGRDPGRAEGLGMALAYFLNPYAPNLDSVREAAMERYHARQED